MDMLSYFDPADFVTVTKTTRSSGGTYNTQGVWVPGTSSTDEIEIIIPQPVRPDELENLPQGEEAEDYLLSFTTDHVQVRVNNAEADRISWGGYTYKVIQVSNRFQGSGFYRFVMVREEGQV